MASYFPKASVDLNGILAKKKDILEMFHMWAEGEIGLMEEGNNSCFFLHTKKDLANMVP